MNCNYVINEGNPRGFFSVLLCVLTAIKKIKDTGCGFTVQNNFKLYGEWNDYFLPCSDIISGVVFKNIFSESTWYFGENMISQPELNVLADINSRYIQHSQESFNRISKRELPNKYLAVHRRGTDHHMHCKIYSLEKYFSVIDRKIDLYDWIYVATDETHSLNEFKNRYGNKVIYQQATRSNDTSPVHYSGRNRDLGYEVLLDCDALSKASEVIFTLSNVSTYARVLNTNLNYIYLENYYAN